MCKWMARKRSVLESRWGVTRDGVWGGRREAVVVANEKEIKAIPLRQACSEGRWRFTLQCRCRRKLLMANLEVLSGGENPSSSLLGPPTSLRPCPRPPPHPIDLHQPSVCLPPTQSPSLLHTDTGFSAPSSVTRGAPRGPSRPRQGSRGDIPCPAASPPPPRARPPRSTCLSGTCVGAGECRPGPGPPPG